MVGQRVSALWWRKTYTIQVPPTASGHASRSSECRSIGLQQGVAVGRQRHQAISAKLTSLHPPEPHVLAIGEPCGDIAACEAGLALRHLLLRTTQRLPPRRTMRRARQRRVDDLLDLLEAQHEFGQRLLLQIIAQGVVIVHGRSRYFFISARRPSRRSARAMPKAILARRKPALEPQSCRSPSNSTP